MPEQEPTYTLTEARALLKEQECGETNHKPQLELPFTLNGLLSYTCWCKKYSYPQTLTTPPPVTPIPE